MSGTASAVLLGARNVVYGASLAGLLRLHGLRRLVGAQLVIDESTAVALGAEPTGARASRLGFWATGLAVFVLWNLATLVGALAGSVIGDPAPSAWTPRRRPRSSPCCRRGCATARPG